MQYISSSNIMPLGDIGARAALLAGRLAHTDYRETTIFTNDKNNWEGDWEGRTLLAQTCISRATKMHSPYVDRVFDAIMDRLEKNGYLGATMPEGEFNEQQLSGHSWLMSGLCEYYRYSGKKDALDAAIRLYNNLYKGLAARIDDYPIDIERRTGGEAGEVVSTVNGFKLSSDTGCVFIGMDGLSRLYELTKMPEVLCLLEKMHNMLDKVDLVKVKAQTHASLTSARSCMRLFRLTGEEKYLATAKKIAQLYMNFGMTKNFANLNWFMRPTWTEPCAVIDSMILFLELYVETRKKAYASMARKIYYNGVQRGQRPNGGFGCDTNVCDGGESILACRTYEASWCCTMRGGEGIERALMGAILFGDDKIEMVLPNSCAADIKVGSGSIRLVIDAEDAVNGEITVKVEENTSGKAVTFVYDEFETTIPEAGNTITVKTDKTEHMRGRSIDTGEEYYLSDAYLWDVERLLKEKTEIIG